MTTPTITSKHVATAVCDALDLLDEIHTDNHALAFELERSETATFRITLETGRTFKISVRPDTDE